MDNGHPDEYETQHTSSEDSLTPYQTKHSNQMGQHNVARAFKKVVKINSYGRTTMYRVGEYVALQDHQSEGTEWIVQITALVVYGQVNNAYAQFLLSKTLADGSVHKDEWI